MPKFNNVYSIVVPAESPVFSAHTYSEVHGGIFGCTVIINGTNVSMGSGSSISILVNTISGGSGCFLFGDNNDVYQGSTELGSYGILNDTINSFVVDDYIEDYFG